MKTMILIYITYIAVCLAVILVITSCATDSTASKSKGCWSETAHSWCRGAK